MYGCSNSLSSCFASPAALVSSVSTVVEITSASHPIFRYNIRYSARKIIHTLLGRILHFLLGHRLGLRGDLEKPRRQALLPCRLYWAKNILLEPLVVGFCDARTLGFGHFRFVTGVIGLLSSFVFFGRCWHMQALKTRPKRPGNFSRLISELADKPPYLFGCFDRLLSWDRRRRPGE